MMNIYYNISSRSDDSLKHLTKKIIHYLINHGYNVLVDDYINSTASRLHDLSEAELGKLYKDTIKSIRSSKIIILEITAHSLTQGLIMEKALQMDKPVIALHNSEVKPVFALAVQNQLLQVVDYSPENVFDRLKLAINIAKENLESRFNFYLSPEIQNYLKQVAKKHKVSRSAFIRNLLKQHMEASINLPH